MSKASAAESSLRLPAVYADHMVLQRDRALVFHGWAKAGTEVHVTLGNLRGQAVTPADGRWRVELAALPAGGPHEVVIRAGKEQRVLQDVLIGDVWVCSGQSNMQWQLQVAQDAPAEIAAAQHPRLRLCQIPNVIAAQPQEDCVTRWTPCTPESAANFSAVAYFFGRRLLKDLDVPVGLIDSSWGGTPAEAWTPLEALRGEPELSFMVKDFDVRTPAKLEQLREEYRRAQEAYQKVAILADPGNKGEGQGWAKPDFDDRAWPTMDLPVLWDTHGMLIDGAVWFRREIDVPAAWAGRDLKLTLGAIDDFDVTYFNGISVGSTDNQTPNWWIAPRCYTVPGKLVRAGRNVIAVRVFDQFASGGFAGPEHRMRLAPLAGDAPALNLTGPWRYAVEYAVPHDRNLPPVPPAPPGESQNSPASLYNAMIHPLIGAPIKGAIWYQGESNAFRAQQYRVLLPAMIRAWRQRWNCGDFPFGIVQLAGYRAGDKGIGRSPWAELREAQDLTARCLPHVGLACAIDIGAMLDIHPRNKQDVGDRLARWALAEVYHQDVVHAGPTYLRFDVRNDVVTVFFTHAHGGLQTRDGSREVTGLLLAGSDRKFYAASGEIRGDTVVARSPQVPLPVAVRYAWADDPACNLCNGAGLPATPFRSDTWPGETEGLR